MKNEIISEHTLAKTVSNLYDMELNNYLTVQTIEKLEYQVNSLGYYQNIPEPKQQQAYLSFDDTGTGAMIGVFIGAIIGTIIGFSNSSGFFSSIGGAIGGLIIGSLIGVALGAVIGFCADQSYFNECKNNYGNTYQREMSQYKWQISQDKERVQKEPIQKEVLQVEIVALKNRLDKSTALTASMYDNAGIDSDFRSLISIGYMNDFIRLGISNKLTGVDGLYYLIKQKINWDLLHTTLYDISQKLNTIINNQDRIYYELCDMNRKCDEIVANTGHLIAQGIERGNTLDEIRQNSAITAYNAERSRVEQEYWNMINL
jgi:hypothetical protein